MCLDVLHMARLSESKNKHSLADVVQQNLSLEQQIAELKAQQAADFQKLFAQGEETAKLLLGKGPRK
jgi:hypothetical protein